MSLAGGLTVGDIVSCRGAMGTVVGGPARAACIRLSVAVRYDDGRIADERVANLELLIDDQAPDEDEMEPLPADDMDAGQAQQQVASQAMWAQPPQRPQDYPTINPAVFDDGGDQDEAYSPESPDDDRGAPYDDRDDGRGAEREIPPGADLFGAGSAGYGPDEAEAAIRDKIYRNYDDMRAAFRAIDVSNNGYVTREDFFQAMGNIFLNNGFSEDDVYEVADRFGLNQDGYISFSEFVAAVEGGEEEEQGQEQEQEQEQGQAPVAQEQALEDDPRIITAVELAIQKFKAAVDQRYSSIRKAFLTFDTDRKSALSPAEFAKGLIAHGIYLSPPELEVAWSLFDRNGTGLITYADFCSVMTQRLQFGTHLRRQLFWGERPPERM